MKYQVPLYSQYLDTKKLNWRKRSCGIVALKTIFDYWIKKQNTPSISTLIKEGLKIDAYLPRVGWKHKKLVNLAKKYGFNGAALDWAKFSPKIAFRKMLSFLKHYPVVASIYKNFNPKNGGHLIVITGFKNQMIFYNEPQAKSRQRIRRKIGLKKFLEGWKRRIIVIYPKNFCKKHSV